jgi:CheY-like chemotaxis protein
MRLIAEVEDTGVGIAEDEMDNLFESFEQTSSGIYLQEGTGLGLAISKQYTDLMGGEMTVTSQVGEGSIFRFDIPIKIGSAEEIFDESPLRQVLGIKSASKKIKVLVVDDTETDRELMIDILSFVGFEVQTAVNGQEAIELFAEWNPDIILMDINMPVMDGREATQKIKETKQGNLTPIIAVTASVFEEKKAEIMSSGVDDFIRKPYKENALLEKIKQYLNLEYQYAEDKRKEKSPRIRPLDSEELNILPPELILQMSDAIIGGYINRLNQQIDQVEEYDSQLADKLRELANRFDYDTLTNLFSQAGGKHG